MIYNIIIVGLALFAVGFGVAWFIPSERDPNDKIRKVFRMVGVSGAITALIAANVFVVTHLFQKG